MRNGNLLKSRVSEICVKRIRVNQGVGVTQIPGSDVLLWRMDYTYTYVYYLMATEQYFDALFSLLYYRFVLSRRGEAGA